MRRRDEAGFTLIELLVSLTLVGLLFAVLFGGLRFGSRAWERSSASEDAADLVRSVQGVLRRDIERACPRIVAAAGEAQIAFSGAPDAVRMLTPAPGAADGGECVAATLAVRADGRLQQLVLDGGNVNAALLRGAKTIAFGYRDANGSWSESWRNPQALPSMVRVRVVFPDGDVRTWPELFIAPRISADPDCTYDPATKGCRGV